MHRLRGVQIAIGWLGVLLALSVQAARVEGLYQAELLVAQQRSEVPVSLLTEGLREVLLKVVGRRELLAQPGVQALLEQPRPYLQQYAYQATRQPIEGDDGREVLAQQLVLEFDRRLVEQALGRAGIRVLGPERPAVLTWILEERGGVREYLGAEEDPALAQMQIRARARGLPLFRPLMDLADTQALPVEEAWGFFEDSIRRASSRYRADAILTGQVYRDGQGWQSRWLLLWNGHSQSFAGEGATLGEQLQSAVDQSADRLFGAYLGETPTAEPAGVLMTVEDLDSLEQYFKLIDYLDGMSSLQRVELVRVEGRQLQLRLVLAGEVQAVKEELALLRALRPLFRIRSEGAAPQLDYRWQR